MYLIILLIVVLGNSKAQEDCNETKFLPDISPFKFKASTHCNWDFIGDSNCTPELSCKTLKTNCNDEYLKITDGLGGFSKQCKTFEYLKSTSFDMFIKYIGNGDLLCEISCSKDKKGITELPLEGLPKEEPRCICGVQNDKDRIVGGEDAKMNEFPWQVAIVFTGTRSPKCGGAIINDRWILTAAHCFVFEKTSPRQIEVLYHARVLDFTLQRGWKDVELGKQGSIRGSGYKEKKYTDVEERTQRYKVIEIVNHPLFTAKYDFDVSLLKLEKKIDLSLPSSPTPICLPKGHEDYVSTKPWVVGWGLSHESAGASTRMLQKLAVPVLKLEDCQKWMPYELTHRMLCAGYEKGEKDACTGDSGGPLSLKVKNHWEQIGIVSWGEGCAKAKRPGLYSRVTDLGAWIREKATGANWCKQ